MGTKILHALLGAVEFSVWTWSFFGREEREEEGLLLRPLVLSTSSSKLRIHTLLSMGCSTLDSLDRWATMGEGRERYRQVIKRESVISESNRVRVGVGSSSSSWHL